MSNLKFQDKLCIPSHDALKDMANHNVTPALVETVIIDGDDYKDKMRGKMSSADPRKRENSKYL